MTRAGSIRASDADREQVVDRLHRAATEGRILAEELEQRVTAALRARTYSELDATVADLPRPGATGAAPARRSGHWVVSAVRANPILLLFIVPALAVTAAVVIAATVLWAVLMVIVLVVGGRPPRRRGPWTYARPRRGYGPPRRGAGGYWA